MTPWLTVPLVLLAHNPDTSYARIKVSAEKIETRLTYDIFTLLKIVPLDDNGDNQLQRAELTRHAPKIHAFLRDHIGLAISEDDEDADIGQPVGFVWPPDVKEAIPAAEFHSANGLIHFDFVRPVSFTPEEVAIAFGFFEVFTERHTVLGVFAYKGDEYETTFTSFEPDFTYVTGMQMPLSYRLRKFFRMGVEHIFLGYDHICFLIALIVVSNLRQIVKIVTSFTVAHSITLILATLDVVRLDTRLVETAIAATIVYVAVENLWLLWRTGLAASEPQAPGAQLPALRHRWRLTFFFGLIHGFGFANVLREMGLPTVGLVRCLLAFNVGVEVGQLLIAVCLFPLAWALNRWRYGRYAVFTISLALALFGLAWFLDRALGLEQMQRWGL